MDPETLVSGYLERLETAAAPLREDRRAELVVEVRGHIEQALAEAWRADEATVRDVLERLGPPDEIVDAETAPDRCTAGVAAAPGPGATRSPWGAEEIRAVVMLTVGALLLPFLGPLLGLVSVWASAQWTTVQKQTATMGVIGLLALPAVILGPMLAQGEITAVFSSFGPLLLLVPLAGILTAIYLVAAIHLLAAIHLEVTLVRRPR